MAFNYKKKWRLHAKDHRVNNGYEKKWLLHVQVMHAREKKI